MTWLPFLFTILVSVSAIAMLFSVPPAVLSDRGRTLAFVAVLFLWAFYGSH